jgi:hypothetical protein
MLPATPPLGRPPLAPLRSAFVSTVCLKSHAKTKRQRFLSLSVIALLPLASLSVKSAFFEIDRKKLERNNDKHNKSA